MKIREALAWVLLILSIGVGIVFFFQNKKCQSELKSVTSGDYIDLTQDTIPVPVKEKVEVEEKPKKKSRSRTIKRGLKLKRQKPKADTVEIIKYVEVPVTKTDTIIKYRDGNRYTSVHEDDVVDIEASVLTDGELLEPVNIRYRLKQIKKSSRRNSKSIGLVTLMDTGGFKTGLTYKQNDLQLGAYVNLTKGNVTGDKFGLMAIYNFINF